MPAKVDKAARLAIAEAAIRDGCNLTRFAKRAGMKKVAAAKWLRDHAPDLHERMRHALDEPSCHAVLVRLLLTRVAAEFAGGRSRLSRALSVSRESVSMFGKRWAPDGMEAAILDLWPGDDEPPEFRPMVTRKTPAPV